MIETFSMSRDCVSHLTHREKVFNALKKRLVSFDRKFTESSKSYIDHTLYESGVSTTVRKVLEVHEPTVADMVEIKVVWEVSSLDSNIHIQMSPAYRSVVDSTPAIYQNAH